MVQKPNILVIVGPTATGKSDLAVTLAQHHEGEVISADSRQVYRGLDIGSGKITTSEMQGIPHHLLDIASPKRSYSVAQFQRAGKKAITQILRRNHLPIIVGGTGFYVDALAYDLVLPETKPDLTLRKQLTRLSNHELHERLMKLDPRRATEIDQHNPVRLIRAIEIATHYGPVAPLTRNSPYHLLWIGITASNEVLRERIRTRLHKRMQQGMLAEAIQLHNEGLSYRRMELLGLEYRFLARHLQGKLTETAMLEQLEQEILNYAKRQMTWFKRNHEIHWIAHGEHTKALNIAAAFLA